MKAAASEELQASGAPTATAGSNPDKRLIGSRSQAFFPPLSSLAHGLFVMLRYANAGRRWSDSSRPAPMVGRLRFSWNHDFSFGLFAALFFPQPHWAEMKLDLICSVSLNRTKTTSTTMPLHIKSAEPLQSKQQTSVREEGKLWLTWE